MGERFRQHVLPEDAFAGIAVDQYLGENPETDEALEYTLRKSADILEGRDGGYHPRQVDQVRGFVQAMIGFPRQSAQDNIRRMNRPTRSGK